jgi:glycosyltransferase involved in cell wall biosynthesis/ubiquinone/menaquinone biosynthesis C-methylase UbiE
MLDEFGLRQIVMPRPSATNNEDDIAVATPYYLSLLRPAFQELQPAYIYERMCLGNSAGALLSAEFKVPYILEYNGSEISMRRSFEGTGYVYEAEYLETEALAFEQATLISVVSSEIRAGLLARGIDPSKIVVNPNGVDLDAYAPAPPAQRDEIRRGLGLDSSDRVVGFTGTFGGWHGIDVLSEAIPRICQEAPGTKFLLIGDGNFKHLVDRAVQTSGLERQVLSMGRVAQAEGAHLLKACDIYVSPHSTHMIDSKFFGSPTKLFEYMALGGGIVASDLEQIGQVLSPALTADEAAAAAAVSRERAVLCAPGDVDQFVRAVVALVRRPELARALGRNAHDAARDHYSWARHVANLWMFLAGATASDIAPDLRRKPKPAEGPAQDAMALAAAGRPSGKLMPPQHIVATGDAYKDQVQRQWNNDPAGSHYVSEAPDHTKEWFLEAEQYRYSSYAPWMRETMEFDRHQGKELLEIGGGMGTDLAQFAIHGATVTDVDLSSGHLKLAKENFAVRGLRGEFVQQDAESLVFGDNAFDVVYSNGVLHHTPNTRHVVEEIFRVLKPGGRAIVMVYAEDSLHYWRNLMWNIGLKEGQLRKYSMGEIMSRTVERSDNAAAHPLVKAYTRAGLRQLFDGFVDIEILQRQMEAGAVPRVLAFVPRRNLAKIMGWNLVIKARKPAR